MSSHSHHLLILHEDEGDQELLAADIRRYYWKDWRRALKRYLADPRDPIRAVEFLELHPANQRQVLGMPFGCFRENLYWLYTRVDPETKRIETRHTRRGRSVPDSTRNTETNVWVEWGPWVEPADQDSGDGTTSHDPRTDTGGRTFEEALVNLAHNIWVLYRANASVSNGARLRKTDRW